MYRFSYERVFQETKDALADAGFRINNVNPNYGVNSLGGLIEASAGASLRSWGENIRVSILGTEDGTQVEIESGEKAQRYDWGKGKQNIDKFFRRLDERLVPAKDGVVTATASVANATRARDSIVGKTDAREKRQLGVFLNFFLPGLGYQYLGYRKVLGIRPVLFLIGVWMVDVVMFYLIFPFSILVSLLISLIVAYDTYMKTNGKPGWVSAERK